MIVGREAVPGNPNLVRILSRHSSPIDIFINDWLDFGLKLGAEITPTRLDSIKRRGIAIQALNQARRYLRVKPRTMEEVRNYLSKKQIDDGVAADVIRLLTHDNIINDELYVSMYVETKKQSLSRTAMAWKLRTKGVHPELIQDGIEKNISEEEEFQLALRMSEKYVRQKGDPEEYKDRLKFMAYLQRKGFSRRIITMVLNRLEEHK